MKPYKVDKRKWGTFSPTIQLKHIAAELGRATQAALRGEKEWTNGAYERAISMIDASLSNPKCSNKSMLYRLRDALAALYAGKTDPAITNFIFLQIMEKVK